MEIVKTREGEKLTLALKGRLDTGTSPQLARVTAKELDDVKELVIDLADMEYVSSAGLRALLMAHRKMNKQGSMVLINANDLVMEIFAVTGFSSILPIREKWERN